MAKAKDYVDLLDAELAADPELQDAVEEESLNLDIAETIYRHRTDKDLTQQQLAELVGTTQSTISRIESSDYDKHTLTTLRRIAKALGKKLRVVFDDVEPPEYGTETVQAFPAEWSAISVGKWTPAVLNDISVAVCEPERAAEPEQEGIPAVVV